MSKFIIERSAACFIDDVDFKNLMEANYLYAEERLFVHVELVLDKLSSNAQREQFDAHAYNDVRA